MEILKIVIPKWNIAEITGYDPMTTFWQWHERDNQKATLYDRRMARRAAGVLLSNNGLKQSVGRCEVSPL